MSFETWPNPSDNLDDYDPARPWPDQLIVRDGLEYYKPASQNYEYGNRSSPAAKHRDALVGAVLNHPATIHTGDTGSGKTTQSALALFELALRHDAFTKVVYAQPRIVLTREGCYRTRQEISYVHGAPHSADTTVGYATGSDSEVHRDNKILYATTGKVFRQVLNNIEDYKGAIVAIDEFHLRETEGDILAALCKKYGITLLIASATIDDQRTANLFADENGEPAPIVHIEHRQHPVMEVAGGDDLTTDISEKMKKRDSIVFVPGRSNIGRVASRAVRRLGYPVNVKTLHGEQSKHEQKTVFERSNMTDMIISTNVGEAGLTPPVDVVFNPGYERANILVEGVNTLTERAASKAKNIQRAGRTGRTRPGEVIFGSKMEGYPKIPSIEFLRDYDAPDIQTQRIDKELLQLLAAGETFDSLPLDDRPSYEEVNRAILRLQRYGAIDESGQTTDIGRHMARLPLEPELARSFVAALEYSDEFSEFPIKMAALAAVQQAQGVVSTDNSGRDGWRALLPNDSLSDPLYALNAFVWATAPERTRDERMRKGFVETKLHFARETFVEICKREGLDSSLLKAMTSPEEKATAVGCLIKGAEEVFVRSGREVYRDIRGGKRRMQRAAMAGKAEIVIGKPWNLQSYHAEMLHDQRYVTSPTVVTREQLEKYAPERCSHAVNGYVMDDYGVVTAKQALYFDGMYINDSARVSVEVGDELRDFLVDRMFEPHMLRRQNYIPKTIRSFCRQLSYIRYQEHKVSYDLDVETRLRNMQDYMKEVIPPTVTTLHQLSTFLKSEDMMPMNFWDRDQLEEIQRDSPDEITIETPDGTESVQVEYDQNEVILRFSQEQLDFMPESFPQFEGRKVWVRIDGRSRRWAPEDAFDRALHPNRAHWRNTVHSNDADAASLARRLPKDSVLDMATGGAELGVVTVRHSLHHYRRSGRE